MKKIIKSNVSRTTNFISIHAIVYTGVICTLIIFYNNPLLNMKYLTVKLCPLCFRNCYFATVVNVGAFPEVVSRLAVIFLTAENIARSCIGSYCLVFAFRDSYLLERIRIIWRNNSISFCFLPRDHSISADNQESRAETEEVIPSRFSIKIWVGFFVFTKQNQLFQSPRAAESDRDHRSRRRSCARRLLVLNSA